MRQHQYSRHRIKTGAMWHVLRFPDPRPTQRGGGTLGWVLGHTCTPGSGHSKRGHHPGGPSSLTCSYASRTVVCFLVMGGSTDQGKLIQTDSSVRFQTYSHFTSDCDFS